MAQFCVYCGAQLHDEGAFCHACGKSKSGSVTESSDGADQAITAADVRVTAPENPTSAIKSETVPLQPSPAQETTHASEFAAEAVNSMTGQLASPTATTEEHHMQCSSCGAATSDNSRFCTQCGAAVGGATDTVLAESVPVQAAPQPKTSKLGAVWIVISVVLVVMWTAFLAFSRVTAETFGYDFGRWLEC